MNKLIKNLIIILGLFVACLFNINISHADNSEDIPKGDDPRYKLETASKFFEDNVKSIKSLIEKYNIQIVLEEDLPTIGMDPNRTSLRLTLEVPKDEYGNFIKDIREMANSNDTIKLTDIYEPTSLGADSRTLTLIIVHLGNYENLIVISLIVLFVIGIIAALVIDVD